MSNTIYCTYLTVYKGNKLPPFYIGSTSVEKINNGYRGSVRSKKYKEIWISELKVNPNLFKTIIITTHNTREEALEKELFFQKTLDVVKSSIYINESYASTNGYFGRMLCGKDNPFFGKTHKEESLILISKSSKDRIIAEETRIKHSIANRNRKGKYNISEEGRKNMKTVRNKRSSDVDKKTSESLKLLWKDPEKKEKFLKK